MLSISHSLTGAFIASVFPHPAVYVPLTLAAHYLEDWIPHWDVGTGLSTGHRKRQTAIMMELIELVITVGLVFLFWQYGHSQIQYHVWLAAFLGLVPDFMEAPRNFLRWEPFFLKPFNEFHGKFHHSTRNKLVGLSPQVGLWVVIFLLR
ncbi:MAG TPA: hypothetical protein VF209_05645 [Patescibacteria group bacterium]